MPDIPAGHVVTGFDPVTFKPTTVPLADYQKRGATPAVSPRVQAAAAAAGIDLRRLAGHGTGVGGRISVEDVRRVAATQAVEADPYTALFGDDGSARHVSATSSTATASAVPAPSASKVAAAKALLGQKSLQDAAAARLNAPGDLTIDEFELLGDIAYGEGKA